MRRRIPWIAAAAAGFLADPSAAEVPPAGAPIATARPDEVAAVFVFGKRRQGIGVAESASEGEVSFAAFADRPLMRPGELAEVVPGLAATQHSGDTKANQYFLRGFNLDHGTDFSVALDGVPLNLPTHAHGQGYLDLNEIIPEVIETIGYRKGPYYADAGDFSNAGTAAFQTFRRSAPSFLEATAGSHDYGRLLAVRSLGDRGFLAGELDTDRGPYDNPDDFRKVDLIGRMPVGDWSLTGLAYAAKTNATDQIAQRAVDAGLISRLGALDPTDGGRTSRFIFSAQRDAGDGWHADLYVQRYTLILFSDFTYFLRDPVHGDQFEQLDDRWVYGGSVVRTWPETPLGLVLRSGLDVRYDDIGKVGLYDTQQRRILSTVREDRVGEYSGALWIEAARTLGPLRLTAGLRLTDVGGRVASSDPRNGGSANQALASPKFTAAWRVAPAFELYADAGTGYHSNDLRGSTIRVVPGDGSGPAEPAARVKPLAASQGGELGGRFTRGGLTTTLSLWALHLDSELVYNGDGGDTASTGATQRAGVELLVDWAPTSDVDVTFSAARSHARYTGRPEGGDRIPNALEYVLTGGVTARLTERATATLTVRSLGPAPLIEDNSARSSTATLFNALVDFDFGRFRLKLEVLNLTDSHDDEIQYFYASRLRGEPADGVDDIHFHPFEPRTVRVGVRVPL